MRNLRTLLKQKWARDLALVAGLTIFGTAVFVYLHAFEYITHITLQHEHHRFENTVLGLGLLLFGSTWFSWRRWREAADLTKVIGERADELALTNQKLVRSEQRLQDFSGAGSDWFWEMDENLRFSYFSSNFTEITGVRQEKLLYKTRQETGIPRLDPGAFQQHLDDLAAHRPFRDFRHPRTKPDGRIVTLSISGKPVFNADGTFKGYRGVGSDITDKTIEEASLLQLQKIEAVGQLTGGIAHDFNNLLAVILGNLQLLENSTRADCDQAARKRIQSALKATNRGSELTTRLLAFARKQTLDPRSIDVNDLINNLYELLSRTLGEDVAIDMQLEDALWTTKVDASQLESAILNLCINARDAMPHGGTLTIRTRNVEGAANISIPNTQVNEGDYALIELSDTGTGISDDIINEVFQPFFTTKSVGQGSGLGLSMVYGFVKQSEGYVGISSQLDLGTTVKIYLPRSHSAPSSIPIKIPEHIDCTGGDETILVVEDNAAVQDVAVTILDDLGYRVLTAYDGKSALKILAEEKVDLLFTDIIMPGTMKGDQLAEIAQAYCPNVKVLLCTGFPKDVDLKQINKQIGNAVLEKPYQAGELARYVRQTLN